MLTSWCDVIVVTVVMVVSLVDVVVNAVDDHVRSVGVAILINLQYVTKIFLASYLLWLFTATGSTPKAQFFSCKLLFLPNPIKLSSSQIQARAFNK